MGQKPKTRKGKEKAALEPTNNRKRKEKATVQETNTRKKEKAALQPANNRKGKEKATVQETNTRKRKEKATVQETNTRKRKGKETAALQPTNTRKFRPNRPDLMPADFGSEEDDHKEPDRKSAMENAREFKDNLKVKSEDAHRSINAFLERNGLHADDPYKVAMQKLVYGDTSLITREILGELFEYIEETIMNLFHYLRKLLIIEKLDDEIAALIVKAIEETHQNLGVRVIELEDIACLARSIMSETVKEFQVAKGGFLRDCIVCWFISIMEYFIDNEKYAEEWIKNPTTSLTTIDPEKTVYVRGVAFKIPRSVN